MPNPRKQDRELDALYASLPAINCQGLCSDSCGPIDMSERERARIIERARKPIRCGAGASCSMLTGERRCGVYEIRPMICRLWGLTPRMRCHYGCVPERWLSDIECVDMLLAANRIGGDPLGDETHKREVAAWLELRDNVDELLEFQRAAFARSTATVAGIARERKARGARSVFERD